MTIAEIEAALQAAFNRCNAASCPLTEQQKQILLQMVEELTRKQLELPDTDNREVESNPLDELTREQLQSFLEFVREQEQQNRPWKIQLMNDWLQDRDSGAVQFIRDRFGLPWLSRIKSVHFAKFAEIEAEAIKLKLGDRIEVSNALWEWVQDNGPCSRQWFPCTVIQVEEANNGEGVSINCIIRFNDGAEYEIQGMYQWNRYNWRWSEE